MMIWHMKAAPPAHGIPSAAMNKRKSWPTGSAGWRASYDVLMQSAAVLSALKSFNRELLRSHMDHCVVRDIRAGKPEVMDELMTILEKLM